MENQGHINVKIYALLSDSAGGPNYEMKFKCFLVTLPAGRELCDAIQNNKQVLSLSPFLDRNSCVIMCEIWYEFRSRYTR